MRIGDVIVSYASNYIQGIGVIISDFQFSIDEKYWDDEAYIREVDWIENMDKISIHNDPVLWIKAGKGPFTRNITIVKLKDFEAERLNEILKINSISIETLSWS